MRGEREVANKEDKADKMKSEKKNHRIEHFFHSSKRWGGLYSKHHWNEGKKTIFNENTKSLRLQKYNKKREQIKAKMLFVHE